jgi:uncharacterized protein
MKTGSTERIIFPSGPLKLEGLLQRGKTPRGVVISHPHPLYGGDMDNYVVRLLAQTFSRLDWTTLTFNFRGVGRSQGAFDQGQGEQNDVLSALSFLRDLGKEDIILAGYSFGAWVNAQAAVKDPAMATSLLISPPLAMLDFSFLKSDAKTKLIISGDRDPFCPVSELKHAIGAMKSPPRLKIIPGADHFYSSGAEELIHAIEEAEPFL